MDVKSGTFSYRFGSTARVLFRQLMIDLPVSRKLLVDLLKSFGIPNAPIADSSCLHSSKTVRNILNVAGSRSEIDLSGI